MIGNLTLGARYHLVEAMWPTGGQKMLSTQVKHLELKAHAGTCFWNQTVLEIGRFRKPSRKIVSN